MKKITLLIIPITIMKTYQLIPESIRSIWSMGTSSSSKAITYAYSTGNGWAAIGRYGNPVKAFENKSWDN